MLGLFFGGRKFQASFGNEWGNVELDAVLEEGHEWSAEVTSNPVEDGAPVSDHIIENPDKLKMRCFVTDAPLNASSSMTNFVNSIVGSLGEGSRAFDNRTQNAFDLLHELMKLKMEMTVYTKHRTYDSMILTNVTIPRSAADGEALEFTAEFMSIRKVATQIVDVPDGISSKKSAKAGGADGSTAKKAEPTKAGGKKQAETVKSSSTLSRIFQ
jgi:hypothetical protein